MYYMESIRTPVGFYGWPCGSYIMYLLRMCPPTTNNLFLAGEDIRSSTKGMHFLNTRPEAPFAMGRGGSSNRFRLQPTDFMTPAKRRDPLLEEIDQWGKLDGAFNNIEQFPTPLPQDPMDDWDYFGHEGPSQITQQNNYYYGYRNGEEESAQGERDGPFGIQVLDVLHRKQAAGTKSSQSDNRKGPINNWRGKAGGNSTGVHLIEKLWEDFNSQELTRSSSALPYWRHRQKNYYNAEEFLTQPMSVRDGNRGDKFGRNRGGDKKERFNSDKEVEKVDEDEEVIIDRESIRTFQPREH